jgi:hypothetical protein
LVAVAGSSIFDAVRRVAVGAVHTPPYPSPPALSIPI